MLSLRGFVKELPEFLTPETAVIERHARVIRDSGDLFMRHPTYWADLFEKLGLANAASPGLSPITQADAAAAEAGWEAQRE